MMNIYKTLGTQATTTNITNASTLQHTPSL
jgi:hypothetical protein